MTKYGYGGENKDGSKKGKPTATKDLQSAIEMIQYNAGINQTGVLDKETVRLLKTPRCGVKDNNSPRISFSKRFVAVGNELKTRNTYYF